MKLQKTLLVLERLRSWFINYDCVHGTADLLCNGNACLRLPPCSCLTRYVRIVFPVLIYYNNNDNNNNNNNRYYLSLL